jgi:Holliday junction resolvase RusA-like endonuclease
MHANFFHLVIKGNPMGKQRHQTSRKGGIVRQFTPDPTANYETLVRHSFDGKYPDWVPWPKETPLWVQVVAYHAHSEKSRKDFGKGKPTGIWAVTKPDRDNIDKIVLDSLNGVAWIDDATVTAGGVYKYRSDIPRIELYAATIEFMESIGHRIAPITII